MKICSMCQQLKELTEFNKNKCKADGLQTICRDCNKVYARMYYKENKDKQIPQIIAAQKKRRNLLRLRLIEYLTEHSCVDCGEVDVVVLEFDHLPEYDKIMNISEMLRGGYSWKSLLVEIDKCEVVCCNCHRRRTVERGNWWRFDYL